MRTTLLSLWIACVFVGCASDQSPSPHHDHAAHDVADGRPRVLVFSATGYYRHPEIARINGWLASFGEQHGFVVDISEDGKDLRERVIDKYDVLLLNNANALDKVVDAKHLASVEAWYKKGGAIVAIHATLVKQQGWPWLMNLGGCDFNSDSDFVEARVLVDPAAKDHPAVKGWGESFMYTADWTNHDKSVTGLPGVQVLLRVDEKTYEPVRDYFKTRGGVAMGDDHPIAWTREWDGGRFFYTELGHDLRSLDTPFGRQHLLGGLRWVLEGE